MDISSQILKDSIIFFVYEEQTFVFQKTKIMDIPSIERFFFFALNKSKRLFLVIFISF